MSPVRKAAKRGARKAATTTKKSGAKTSARKVAKKAAKKAAKKSVKKATTTATTSAAPPTRAPAPRPKARALSPEEARAAAKAERRGRAARRQAFLADRRGVTDIVALQAAMRTAIADEQERRAASARAAAPRRGRPGPRAVASNDPHRWVPIGPSVVRRGQADGRPRVSGRVRDLVVDSTGRRAYAGSGKAGVWYTDDAGASWRMIGGQVTVAGVKGGASTDMSVGCLLVQFGANAGEDYVMVGTGEVTAKETASMDSPAHYDFGSRGVLAGTGPATIAESSAPFEPETGIALFEGTGINRLVRDPARRTLALAGADGDRVLAAADSGLFLGERTTVQGTLRWQWRKLDGLNPFLTTKILIKGTLTPRPASVVDVQWVPVTGTADGRIYVTVAREGVLWSDGLGAAGTWNWVRQLNRATDNIQISGAHRMSELVNGRIYVLYGRTLATKVNGRDDAAFLDRIPNATRPVADGGPDPSQRVPGVPDALWGTQRFWDQAICVDRIGSTDRVWVGGSGVTPYTGADFCAAIYCYDVNETVPTAPRLVPAAGVSRTAAPPAGEGADIAALAGNGIHADVHVICTVPRPDGSRHVWTGTDGGVYVSERDGRVNTFQSRVTGLAVIEAGFVAVHPRSSQYCALGAQDNGSQSRAGDTVWELIEMGDGGGQMFHPASPQYIVSQYTSGTWNAVPMGGFVDPLSRTVGGGGVSEKEDTDSLFYSGCDAIATTAGRGRMALGTTRVWLSDDLGVANPNTWRVIRFRTSAPMAAADARPGGANAHPTYGMPEHDIGAVVQVRWESPTRLYAVYVKAIVRFDEVTPGTWSTTMVLDKGSTPDPTAMRVSDLAPIPGTTDFYFTTLGDDKVAPATPMETCWVCINGTCTATGLRAMLVPNDPANAVCLDPENPSIVYVGTLGGLWKGTRTVAVGGAVSYNWAPFMNGLPVTCVSDLRVWRTPDVALNTAAPLKLLRAATQSRGVWEANIVTDAVEPPRTWLRVHARDDRRVLPTPMADPRLPLTGAAPVAYASPDIVVRPAPRASALPALAFPFRDTEVIGSAESGSFHLWEFQTAFRWIFPAIRADGLWTEQLADLIEAHRMAEGLGRGRTINKATWDNVVGGRHLTAAREVRTTAADHWAVYETPWQLAGAADTIATEVDTLELVQPQRVRDNTWQVPAGTCRVDVTLHHRDTRPVAANGAYTALFRKSGADKDALLASLSDEFSSLFTWNGTPAVPTPTGWTRVMAGANAVHRLTTALDAFMPRAISVDLDLSADAAGTFVLLVALCGSSAENPPAPAGLVNGASTVVDMVRAWPRAAMRLIQVGDARRTVP